MNGLYYEEESGAWRKASLRGKREEAEELGIRLAKQLKHPGKVWLVGAGPGDIGLFTLKGMEVLKNAEVVVYDSLVGQGCFLKFQREYV